MTEDDLRLLAFERRFYTCRGAKEQAVLDELGLSPTRYYQRLVGLLDDPGAWAAEPVVMGRVARLVQRRAG